MSTIFAVRGMDLRKARRKPLHYPAWIDVGDGSALRDCLIYDISETGARLTIAGEEQVPDNFTLLLSRDGARGAFAKSLGAQGSMSALSFYALHH